MGSPEQIRGPLGIWTFPILNTIITISQNNNNKDRRFNDEKVEEIATVFRDEKGNIERVEIVKND